MKEGNSIIVSYTTIFSLIFFKADNLKQELAPFQANEPKGCRGIMGPVPPPLLIRV